MFLLIWPWDLPPISTNWGTSGQYASMGTDVARLTGDEPVATSWEIGTPVFFCRCPLLDWFGDRARTDELVAQRLAVAGPVTRAVARWNFAYRAPTPPTATRWVIVPGRSPGAVATWRVENPARGPMWASLVATAGP